jgi:uncharacterized glyoxalase superfamily protein PhnB
LKFASVTPNLVVADIALSIAFYRDLLGFSIQATVPDKSPFAFAWMQRDGISVFLNTLGSVKEDLPGLAARPIGGTNTMYIAVEAESPEMGVDALFDAIHPGARVMMPLTTQFYGMREFGIEDPDGYVIFVGQRVAEP